MTKNSKSIKFISFISYALALACLGFFIYEMVVLKGKYMENIAILIGLGCGVLTFTLVGVTLSPIKLFSSNNINFVVGLILCALSGVTLAFCIYNCVTNFDLKILLICIAIILASVSFGVFLLKVAKQDINVEAREKQEKKEAEMQKIQERKAMTKCPFCGCRITEKDTNCPNCKSKL